MKLTASLLTALFLIFGIHSTVLSQKHTDGPIKWVDFEEAMELAEKKPKKIFIDMYTDWCGWCKKMDQTTFKDPVIAEYMNEHYYAVKFDAERKDSVVFKGQAYVNPNPSGKRSSHQLAAKLMNGRMSYPSFVFLSATGDLVTIVPGYQKAPGFEPILHFIAEDAYQNQKWETYNASFKGKLSE